MSSGRSSEARRAKLAPSSMMMSGCISSSRCRAASCACSAVQSRLDSTVIPSRRSCSATRGSVESGPQYTPTIAPAALSLRSRIAVFGSSIRQTAIRMPEKSTRVVRLSMVSRNTGMCCSAYSIASSPLALRISVMESMLCVPSHRNSSLCSSVIVASSTVMPHCWA